MNKIEFFKAGSSWIQNNWQKGDVQMPTFILVCLLGIAIAFTGVYASLRGRVKSQPLSSTGPALPEEDFKKKILEKPGSIDYAKYPFARLNKVSRENSNLSLIVGPIPNEIPEKIKFYSIGARYYGYFTDGCFTECINDSGWGCGWRSTQTFLSYYGIHDYSIEDLFHIFGSPEKFTEICERLYPKKFSNLQAGYQTRRWIEPFTTKIIGEFFGINSELKILHSINSSYTPQEAFPDPENFMNFSTFKDELIKHFDENRAPVMLDDRFYTFSIIGIGCDGDSITLQIADPHIKAAVNRYGPPWYGIYTITLDKDGNQTACSLTEDIKKEKMYDPNTYVLLNFNGKPWMVLFPTTKKTDRL